MGIPVLHLMSRFWVGGSERQFIERLRRHPEGFDPHLACLELSGGMLDDFLALGLPPPAVFPITGSFLRPNTLVQIGRIARLIRKSRIQIVHATEFFSNFMGLLAGRLAGARVIVSRVDLGHPRLGFSPWHRRVEKWMSASADAVCANAEAVRRLCIEEEGCSPEKVFVVRNGIDLVRFDALARQPLQGPLPEAKPLVGVIANLWPIKGHRSLLEAISRVRRAVPQAHFALAGTGSERQYLAGRIAELGLERNVTVLGTRYDVPAILARCDAACHPSLAEGLPNAVMEAMAASLPVVATAVGGTPELISHGETGLLVPPDAPEALAAALVELLSDPERGRRMGRRGRAKVQAELSLELLARGHGALYRTVLGGDVQSQPVVGASAANS